MTIFTLIDKILVYEYKKSVQKLSKNLYLSFVEGFDCLLVGWLYVSKCVAFYFFEKLYWNVTQNYPFTHSKCTIHWASLCNYHYNQL